ncbi:transcription factor IIIA [Drosophila innubila]|uniref:transcription factor IIIA n=1 Tax=Drosophila innubila TaxID=198719 RepID=UPI00148DB8A6|nr:transcription factor IIIA [Drosophila innubila]
MLPEQQITSDSDLDVALEEFKLRQTRRDSTGPKYNCSISGCEASFKRLDQLDRHEFHHTGIKKHACTYDGCGKIYSILSHLKRHVRSTHERTVAPQKTIKCSLPECSKLFTSSCNMQRHVREAHESPREYPCTHCTAKFRQKMKLRRHEITQHTQDYPYRCEKCARGFYQQWQQESHQRSCKLYACSEPTCQLQFDKWTLYTKHCRETLHGRSHHKCDHCDRSYEKPSDLAKHIAAKHTTTIESAFPCTEPGCNRTYSYERNLRQHVVTAHSGKRFECLASGCGRGFSSAQNLSRHLIRDHTKPKPKASQTPAPKKPSPTVEAKKTRKRRRDAGQPARSRLSKLACLVLDKNLDQEVRLRKPLALKNVAKEIEQEQQQSGKLDINEQLEKVLHEEQE